MNLNFDLDNDKEFEESLEQQGNGGFLDTKDLEYVDSGIYSSEITSAFIKTITNKSNGETSENIDCTCVAYSKTGEVLGKFNFLTSLDRNNKFYTKTLELCFVTGNRRGLEESVVTRKDGSVVESYDGTPLRQYKELCGKRIYVGIFKKGEITASNGNVYPSYSLYFLYDKDKRTAREIRNNLPATQVSKDWAYLQKKIAEQKEQDEAREKLNTPVEPTQPAFSPAKADDDLPF